MKTEFGKILLIVDYSILLVLLLCTIFFPAVDLVTIDVAWIAQVGISSGMYYWKAKNENRVKIPFKVIQSLSDDMKEGLDLSQIIVAIIQSE